MCISVARPPCCALHGMQGGIGEAAPAAANRDGLTALVCPVVVCWNEVHFCRPCASGPLGTLGAEEALVNQHQQATVRYAVSAVRW